MQKRILFLILSFCFSVQELYAANAAQNLKAIAAQARITNAAAIKAQQDAAIARMTTLLTAEANKGEEKYALPQSDADFKLWSAPAGLDYLALKGFSTAEVSYANGRVLEISWANPNSNP